MATLHEIDLRELHFEKKKIEEVRHYCHEVAKENEQVSKFLPWLDDAFDVFDEAIEVILSLDDASSIQELLTLANRVDDVRTELYFRSKSLRTGSPNLLDYVEEALTYCEDIVYLDSPILLQRTRESKRYEHECEAHWFAKQQCKNETERNRIERYKVNALLSVARALDPNFTSF